MSGKMDITVLEKSTDPSVRKFAEELLKGDAKAKSGMSPAGALGLPKLLDRRRLEYGIPDGAFRLSCAFDRIYVYQLEWDNKETYGDTSIVKPDSKRARDRTESPRGVLIAAGLRALDALRSNGFALGHIVGLIELAPYRVECDTVDGRSHQILIMNAGDLIGSEDLAEQIKNRTVRIVEQSIDTPDGVKVQHVFVDENGKSWNPAMPGMTFDQ